ncbi:hypothetical protein TWF694_007781 [Orbilia ellipsospora]|uniref:Uncharacterized protein n=1 Tax=Orbilia ellipsospora TaxID=2528407 RepID=A0AAV9XJQ3_9PEZI
MRLLFLLALLIPIILASTCDPEPSNCPSFRSDPLIRKSCRKYIHHYNIKSQTCTRHEYSTPTITVSLPASTTSTFKYQTVLTSTTTQLITRPTITLNVRDPKQKPKVKERTVVFEIYNSKTAVTTVEDVRWVINVSTVTRTKIINAEPGSFPIRRGEGGVYYIPKECSCFLTHTKILSHDPTTTSTVTEYYPTKYIALTITKHVTTTKTYATAMKTVFVTQKPKRRIVKTKYIIKTLQATRTVRKVKFETTKVMERIYVTEYQWHGGRIKQKIID